ncbi:MAG TPA: hypothetical protein VGT78_10825 [Rhizomicrobium sp.]|nr:hypothetical protein [Rhizomicrobium sp.]
MITGTDFGDNLIATLPGAIGNTIGNLMAGQINSQGDSISVTGNAPSPLTVAAAGDNTDIIDGNTQLPAPLTDAAIPYDAMTASAAPIMPVEVGASSNSNGGFLTAGAQQAADLAARQLGFPGSQSASVNYSQLAQLEGPAAEVDPENVPGYDKAAKDAYEGYDSLPSNAGNGEIVGAEVRQAHVDGAFQQEEDAVGLSPEQPPVLKDPQSGESYTLKNGVTFFDRNNDGSMDVAYRTDLATGTVQVNYGTYGGNDFNAGWQTYNPKLVLPAPPIEGTTSGPPGSGYE